MINDTVRKMVERLFPDVFGEREGEEAEFRQAIYETLEAGRNLYFWGQSRGCGQEELMNLKEIEAAHRRELGEIAQAAKLPRSAEVEKQLEIWRADYAKQTGSPFEHFFCPILAVDEDVALQKGHVVNTAFADSSRAWVVQRCDVDNFYGAHFERDFQAIQYRDITISRAITDLKMNRLFEPKLFRNDDQVTMTGKQGTLPRVFTPVTLQSDQPDVRIGIKLTPDDLIATANQEWEVRIDKDLRVPALVSLIKAAHLTVFRMCGYIYALHTAGLLIGNNILGEFYRKNKDQPREVILRNAETFFREWVTMVRPMIWSARSEFEGTVSDRKLLVCVGTSGRMWGMIVLIKTAHEVHAVLLPAFTDVDSAATYLEFLRNDNENIHIGSAEYDGDNRCWLVGTERAPLRWPKPGEDAT